MPDLAGFILKQAADGNRFGLSITSQLYFQKGNAPNKQSLSEARQKLSWTFFKEFLSFLNQEKSKTLWKSHAVKIIDGTKIRLQHTKELIANFGCQSSQHGPNHYPSMNVALLSDAFSSHPYEIAIGECNSSERDLATKLIAKISAGDIVLLDRGLGGANIYRSLSRKNIFFVHRSVVKGICANYVREFLKSKKESKLIDLQIDQNEPILKLRLVRGGTLPSGEPLVYVTNLLDSSIYSAKEIHQLYGLRWKIETNIGLLKNTLGIEKIKSRTTNSVLQDIYAHFILLALAASAQSKVSNEMKSAGDNVLSIKFIFKLLSENIFYLVAIKSSGTIWKKICEQAKRILWKRQPNRQFPRYSRLPQNRWTQQRSAIKKGAIGKNSR